jgi:hypothetical protein
MVLQFRSQLLRSVNPPKLLLLQLYELRTYFMRQHLFHTVLSLSSEFSMHLSRFIFALP